MSKSKNSNKLLLRFGIALGALILFWFALMPYRESRALDLVSQATAIHSSDPNRAVAMVTEANFIKKTHAGTIRLAEWQVEAGDADLALATLEGASEDQAYWLVKGKALLELNHVSDARSALAKSADPRATKILALMKSLEKPGDKTVDLAWSLGGYKFFRTAERTLADTPKLNTSGTIMLAEIRLGLGEKLTDMQSRLEKAVANDPSDIQLHQLLQRTYQKLGNQKGASAEAAKIDSLKAGKP